MHENINKNDQKGEIMDDLNIKHHQKIEPNNSAIMIIIIF